MTFTTIQLEKAIKERKIYDTNDFYKQPALVQEIQLKLGIVADGVLGPATKKAIKEFCDSRYLNSYDRDAYGPMFFGLVLKYQPEITNQAGINLIKEFEGCRLTTYLDIVGVPTIGFGSTGSYVKMGMTITRQNAEDLLKRDLKRFEKAVKEYVHVALNPNQFSALVAFSFNVGTEALRTSTLLKRLNARNYAAAAQEFARWNKAGGKVVAGLIRRRAAERKLFETKS